MRPSLKRRGSLILGLFFMILCFFLALCLTELMPTEMNAVLKHRRDLQGYYVADAALTETVSYLEAAFYNADYPGATQQPLANDADWVPQKGETRVMDLVGSSADGDYAPRKASALSGRRGQIADGWTYKSRLQNITPTDAVNAAFRVECEAYYMGRLLRRISAVVVQDSLLKNVLYADAGLTNGASNTFSLSGGHEYDGPVTIEGKLRVDGSPNNLSGTNPNQMLRLYSELNTVASQTAPAAQVDRGVLWSGGKPNANQYASILPNTGATGISNGVVAPVSQLGVAQKKGAITGSGTPEPVGDRDPINDIRKEALGNLSVTNSRQYGIQTSTEGGIFVQATTQVGTSSARVQSASLTMGVAGPDGKLYTSQDQLTAAQTSDPGLSYEKLNQSVTIGITRPLVGSLNVNVLGISLPVGPLLTSIPIVDDIVAGVDNAILASRSQSQALDGTFNVVQDFPVTASNADFIRVTVVPEGNTYRGRSGPITVYESLNSAAATVQTTPLSGALPANIKILDGVPAKNIVYCDGQLQNVQGVVKGQLTIAASDKMTVGGSITLAGTPRGQTPVDGRDSLGLAGQTVEVRMSSNAKNNLVTMLLGETAGGTVNNVVNGVGGAVAATDQTSLTGAAGNLVNGLLSSILGIFRPPGASQPLTEGGADRPYQLYASVMSRDLQFRLLQGTYLDTVGSVLEFAQAGTSSPQIQSYSSGLSALLSGLLTPVLNLVGGLLDTLLGNLPQSSSRATISSRYNPAQRFSPPPEFGLLPRFSIRSFQELPVNGR